MLQTNYICLKQDKILQGGGGGIQVTNDGATILRSIGVDNPAAKVLVGMKHCILIVQSLTVLASSVSETVVKPFNRRDVCLIFRFISRARR